MPAELTLFDWTVRLATAAVLSGMIGFEREAQHKAAGLRTHMLVGLGSGLFTMLSAYGFGPADTTRIAAQIVSGIGFLGAGAIFRDGANVRGLTTAAGLWAVAAIGMTTGIGLILGAVAATVLGLVILYGLGFVERFVRARQAQGRRPIGVRLDSLRELSEVVMMATSLDPSASQVEVEHFDGDVYQLRFTVAEHRLTSVATAVQSFETVVGAGEIDPL